MTVGGQPLRYYLEARNHAEALDQVRALAEAHAPISPEIVLQLHALMMDDVLPDAGQWRELAVVQIWDGARIVPSAALIPIDRAYMPEKAGLNLERVIHGILDGGLNLDDAQAAWERAIGHVRRADGQ